MQRLRVDLILGAGTYTTCRGERVLVVSSGSMQHSYL